MNASSVSPTTGRPCAPRGLRLLDHWFFARPVLMPPVWTILILSAAPALFSVQALSPVSARVWVGLALCFFLYGGVYIINQVFDIESDRLNKKLYFLPQGIFTVRSAVLQYVLFTAVALGGGWFMGRAWFLTTLAVVVLGVLYSLPPVRLKDRPIGSLLANAVGHGTLVYYLGWALTDSSSIPPSGGSVSYALAVAGVYLLTTIPDREGDRISGKMTLSARFGPRTAATVALVCVMAAGLMGVVHQQWAIVISAGIALPFFAATVLAESFCGRAVRVALLSLSFFACLVFWPYLLIIAVLYISTRWYYRRRFGMVYPRMSEGGQHGSS